MQPWLRSPDDLRVRVASVILAGGAARRMGGIDKPLLVLGGQSLLDRVIGRLRAQTAILAISGNGDAARFSACGLEVLADIESGQGPLGGILSGLLWARTQGADAMLSIPGDTPFIPLDLMSRLAPAPAVACCSGRRHHAVALWPVSCLDRLDEYLRQGGSRAVRDFAARIGMREVDFAPDPFDPFFNINTPDDLRLAEAMLSRLPAPSLPGRSAG